LLNDKKKLRADLRRRYQEVTPCDLSDAVRAMPSYRAAKTVALYYAGGFEASVNGLLSDSDKILLLPRCEERGMVFCRYDGRLAPDRFGIPAPAGEPWQDPIDLMLVPALAFDKKGYRLGRGGGFYDRALVGFSGQSVGVIREAFLLDAVPIQAHDEKVGSIVTEKGVYIIP
jgi:5-formyltetrahydrofolate cyclo-ligase